ncbi:MAG: hypothetical protein D4R70_05500 [Betaproteobacteria bacterium]|nr:MAG: hypothetical protein D4R70_05500 [Betaproteobacteria bacterium]
MGLKITLIFLGLGGMITVARARLHRAYVGATGRCPEKRGIRDRPRDTLEGMVSQGDVHKALFHATLAKH